MIVVDDGSTDGTPAILQTYGDRVRHVRQQNQGVAPALNHGLSQAKGAYVAWLSSDDLFLPEKIARQAQFLDENPSFDLVYTDFYEIDGDGTVIREVRSPWYANQAEFTRAMLRNNFVNGSSILGRREALERVGGFDTGLRFQSDGTTWFRMLAHGAFGHLPLPLVKYRWHTGNASHRQSARLRRDMGAYYDQALAIHPIERLFRDRLERRGWRAEAERDIGDILAYRQLYGRAAQRYLRSLALEPASVRTTRSLAACALRAARQLIRAA